MSVSRCEEIGKGFKTAGLITGFVVGSLISPVIGVVAIPIILLMSIKPWYATHKLYKATLIDGKRESFGRIPEQCYLHFTGRERNSAHDSPEDRSLNERHASKGLYLFEPQFKNDNPGQYAGIPGDCPINSKEDLEWLKKEYKWLSARAGWERDVVK